MEKKSKLTNYYCPKGKPEISLTNKTPLWEFKIIEAASKYIANS